MSTVNHFTGYGYAQKVAPKYDAIISLGHELNMTRWPHIKYLFLDFDDLDLNDIASPLPQDKFCTKEHINQMIEFVRGLNPKEKLLIHCFAGLNRSSAATIIAKCERDKLAYWHAVKDLVSHRIPGTADINPNSLMINHYLADKKIYVPDYPIDTPVKTIIVKP